MKGIGMQSTSANRQVAHLSRQRLSGVIPGILDIDLATTWFGIVEISPEASSLVIEQLNIGNRRKRSALVDYLVRQIKNGEWQEDHPQPITFSDLPRLIDGQHRLFAIEVAGVTVRASVKCGVRDALREYVDTGISRQLEDRVEFDPDLGVNRRLAQLVNCAHWMGKGKVTRPTPSEAVNVYEAHKDAFRFAEFYLGKRQRGITSVAVCVALSEYWERNNDKAQEFADALIDPDSQVQQAKRLREFLISASNCGGQSMTTERYQKSVGCMIAHSDGRKVASVRAASWK